MSSKTDAVPEVESQNGKNGVEKNGHAATEESVSSKLPTPKKAEAEPEQAGDAEKNTEEDEEEEENVEEEEEEEEEAADEEDDEEDHEEEETGEESNGAPPAKSEPVKKLNGVTTKHKLDDGQNGGAVKKANVEVEDAPEKTNGAAAEAAAE